MSKPSSLPSRCLSLGLVATLLAFSGCAAQRSLTNAKPTAFLISTGKANMGKNSRVPFQQAWRDRRLNPASYSRLVIRPVNTRYLHTEQWQESAGPIVMNEHDFKKQADLLARYWDGALREAFAKPGNRFTVTNNPAQPGTLVMEIALTEVVFGRPAATVASYAVPGGGVANSLMFSPTVAFEIRVIDPATGRVVATAADLRGGKIKAIDVNSLTFTETNKEICREWSGELMQAFNREMFPRVKRNWVSLY